MLKPAFIVALVVSGFSLLLAACDVDKQMDTMVDNPSFAEPLFTKFMARSEYQVKAMDTILADPGMRQLLLEKISAEPDYARALVEQMVANPQTRELIAQTMAQPAETVGTP